MSKGFEIGSPTTEIWALPLVPLALNNPVALAQAGRKNSPNWLQQNIGNKVTGHPVSTERGGN